MGNSYLVSKTVFQSGIHYNWDLKTFMQYVIRIYVIWKSIACIMPQFKDVK